MESVGALVFIIVCSVIIGGTASIFVGRPFSKWFVYGLFLLPLAAIHLIVAGAGDETGSRAPKIGAFLMFLLLFAGSYYLYQEFSGFQTADVEDVKQSIKAEFEKQPGVTVTDVSMIRDGNRRLIGVANVAISGIQVAKSCEATMGDGRQYLWTCK